MAFPQVASRTNTAFPTAATTHSANYPATVDAGDLLLLLCGFKADPTITTPAGFSSIAGGQASGSAAGNKSGLYGRVADGTEGGGTVSITINQSRRGSAQIIRVTGWYGTLAGVEAAFVNTSGTTNPNPPSLSPSWGSAQNLFIAGLCTSDDDEYPTAAPTNYTDISYIQAGGGADVSVTTATALRELEAASDDPGTFTLNESGNSGAYTIAVRPSSGGAAYSDSISLGVSAGLSTSSVAAAFGSVSLGVSSGLSLLSVVSASDAVSIGLSAGLTYGAMAAASDAVSLGLSSGLGATGAAAAVDTLSLGLAAGINNSGTAAALGAISVGIGLGLSVSDAQQYSDNISLGVSVGVTAAAVAAASDGFTLILNAGISTAGQAAAQATITIGITADILFAAQASTFDAIQIGAALGMAIAGSLGAIPPDSRTIGVPGQGRTIEVSAQGRTIQVQIQTRTIVV